ncbi:MAG: hypothetical protein ACPL88_12300 [Bryobacteraceae bacterium]
MKQMIAAAVVAAALLAAVPASAQMITRASVQVPFAFATGNTVFPAGVCDIQSGPQQYVVVVRCEGMHDGVLLVTSPGNPLAAGETSRVVFHRYGERYFLAEIRLAGRQAALHFLKSRAERELACSRLQMGKVILALR